ncbi:hypothetical protein [Vitiosangium sp. GDMCC 1.1324]|uniref:hypothetical protein n=1 Tax=Vitiosangium sp. (strain GDMCC 1.1324) TaxID=2138576 RepID=UPI000D370B06|nr:hypothetical protein [Vitiosangium sp. GDMCC 1.1324]PTL82281.1 hypothetical protein DAT35_21065 [Vitiosangium sp. GDMCC 1.1324]
MSLVLSGGLAGAGPAKPPEPVKKEAKQLEGEMLIWSGGKTRDEAERQQQDLAAYQKVLDTVLPLSPQVLESARIQGLKPGFFVVALGVCPKDEVSEPLGVLQAIYPDVYTRTVKYPAEEKTPALGCPELESVANDSADEPVRWSLHRTERLEQGGSTLIGLAFTYSWEEAGDFARAYHDVKTLYLLVGKKRRLVDSEVQDGPSDATTLESFTSEEGHLVSQLKYADPRCDPGGDFFKGWRKKVRASIEKGRLKLSEDKPVLLDQGACGFADEARMVTGQDHLEQESGSNEEE